MKALYIESLQQMMNERLKNDKNIEFLLSKALPKRRVYKIIRVLSIRKYVLSGHHQSPM